MFPGLLLLNFIIGWDNVRIGQTLSQEGIPFCIRTVKGNGFEESLHGFLDAGRTHPKRFSNLLMAGLSPELLGESLGGFGDSLPGFGCMDGNADCPRLIGQSPQNSLAYPPSRVGAELEAFAILKSFGSAHKANVAFLDEV